MNKVYTIIAFFSIGKSNRDECWIANFKNKKDAFSAFKQKIEETEKKLATTDDKCLKELFNRLMTTGNNIICRDGTMFFVRHEKCYDKFNPKIHSWN